MRCFVALALPAPVQNHLMNVVAPLRERYDLKWIARDQLHVTLVFAGGLPDENFDALVELVETVEVPPMQLVLQRFGWFPPRGVPRVVWVELDGDVALLTRVQAELAAGAEPLGVPGEKRGFTPHVTIGRLKGPFGALALCDQLRKTDDDLNRKPFAPPALVLYRSTLTPSGPHYETLLHRALT